MKKNVILSIVGIGGILLSILLLVLPKTVVTDADETVSKTTDSTGTESTVSHDDKVILSKEAIAGITVKKDSLAKKLGDFQKLNLSIAAIFAKESVFDSAGYYLKVVAAKENNTNFYNQAGDLYFQAYSLALDPIKREKLAEQTREMYDIVIKQNPRDLHSRTNKAMTFVSSESPMQAIALLRQVLSDEPKYTPAIMSLGALSMQSGQYDKAIERFKEVVKLDPTNTRGKLGLAYSLLETKDKAQGVEILKNLLNENIDEVLRNEIENTLNSIK